MIENGDRLRRMPATPTRRKRRLGQLLLGLRDRAAKSLADSSELLRVAESTVSRYETGHVRPGWATMQALLAFYGAEDHERVEAAAMWEDAAEQATRVVTPAGSSKALRAFLRAENEADTARHLEPLVIPGLLQTHAYARALNLTGQQFHSTPPQRYVTARLSRQARLSPPSPMNYHALIDEGVIRRVVGGPEVMVEQLRHLLVMAERDNVTLQIVPFGIGAYATMTGGFVILGYQDAADPPAVYVASAAGGNWVENGDDVTRFADTFDEVTKLALSTDESSNLIRSQVGALDVGLEMAQEQS
ncbi:helix-turn-helix domain-containing protein [Saccharopolyspora erythraea]|uniref:helix-turn-helix domain-containing protein n=1 Tax=Saccharopolyspora erythraea TaxID=1836 RepID=UPI001BAA2279|nr:helix-turn-helix transcriptional regulator [Saccharopolyspora erythraea]QUG99541.1 helix-turn-helix domain-containing protein [Saccharopolyspora erythraea]